MKREIVLVTHKKEDPPSGLPRVSRTCPLGNEKGLSERPFAAKMCHGVRR